ncbi:MAG: methylmalonyl Co-A mutase-associated GTPase MeaB, partial [Ignavibacteriae bacterium]|nr:methylmalonyl Co-A mutase-associated GTPase MeaB [Ignavibacteriota bacterium]
MKNDKTYKPDWTPKNAGKEFAANVVKGVEQNSLPKLNNNGIKSQTPSVDELVSGVLDDNRNLLARSITLIESNSEVHHQKAAKILEKLLPHSGKSIRIGISGVPGAGKSTLIEALGLYLIGEGHKVAVLTVDPSSSVSKGSILGDKTRMEKL